MHPSLEPQLRRLVAAFLEENGKMNLSAFRTEEQCWRGNVLDSLAALELPLFSVPVSPSTPTLPLPRQARDRLGEGGVSVCGCLPLQESLSGENTQHTSPSPIGGGARGEGKNIQPTLTILDLGTGGGFPLLPLALALPHARLTGLDSVRKKVEAVGRIARSLGLTNVSVIAGRAEEEGRKPEEREQFDVVTSRAVAELNVLLEYAAPFVKPKGHIVLWKSASIERELQDSLLARAELSVHLVHRHTYDLGEGWGKRQLLVFQKTAPLSEKYPREVGVPGKRPLK